MPGIRIYPVSEKAVTIEFGKDIDPETHHRIMQVDLLLRKNGFNGFVESVPAYATLTVYYDPLAVLEDNRLKGFTAHEKVKLVLSNFIEQPLTEFQTVSPLIKIPVCYDSSLAPDLDFVSNYCHLTKEEIIRLHTALVYTVFMIGFSPGFPYLGILDARLEVPRKDVPNNTVPPGSVAIAGRQTGIYPFETPGGWQLIGRTPIRLFDAAINKDPLLKAGYRVQFESISSSEFTNFQQS